jgi:hypothetical protein
LVVQILPEFVIFAAGLLGFEFAAARLGRDARDGHNWLPEEL